MLVLQLRRIGELVLTTPALNRLRESWPGARITIVLSDLCADLASALPRMDEVLIFRPKLWQNRKLLQRLLTGSFDICLDFTGTDRSALFSLASRARRRVAFDWAKKGPLRQLVYQKFVHVEVNELHTIDRMLELLRPVGIDHTPDQRKPFLNVPAIAQRRVNILLTECGITGDFVLIHPGTAAVEKYWLPERWAEIILHLQRQHGLPCVLTGGSDPHEQEHLRAIHTALAMLGDGPLSLPLITLAGQLDLTLLTALVARCSLAICCDTAVMHMASAFERPQISLFGPTNPFEWHPRHSLSRIICATAPGERLDSFSPTAPGAPMADIPSTSVCKEIDQLLPLILHQA